MRMLILYSCWILEAAGNLRDGLGARFSKFGFSGVECLGGVFFLGVSVHRVPGLVLVCSYGIDIV